MSDLQIAINPQGYIVIKKPLVDQFKLSLRGALLCPGDQGYDAARKVYNAMIDKRPALIVCCAGVADVIAAVEFCREHNLLVAVRGGGHNVGGKSVGDGGVLIDLSPMKGMRVDPGRRTAFAQPGLRLGEFDIETQAFGLATTLGIISNTGISGLTLGGGIGWLNGRYALACDNLLSLDVVTADGRLMKADADENSDLFWAMRGCGANFGIATSLEYRLHPVGTVIGGLVLHPISDARKVLRFYDDFSRSSGDDISTLAALLRGPDGSPLVAIAACHCGDLPQAERTMKQLKTFGLPVADLIEPRKYADMQRLADESWLPGRLHYWKSSFIRSITDDAIDMLAENFKIAPSPLTWVALQQMHGAATRVGATATAFPHRHEQYDFAILAQWIDPADSDKNIRWTHQFWDAMQPHLERSVYVNNLGEEDEDRVRAAYGPNYDRLAALKAKYDPTNFFHLNQNIQPTPMQASAF